MKNSLRKIQHILQQLAATIEVGLDSSGVRLWRGADVRITDDPEFVHRPRHWLDHDVVVCTRHAKEMSALIFRLRDTFGDWIDFLNKYGFYEALANAALEHLASHQPESDDARPLLRCVLEAAIAQSSALDGARGLPPNASIVFHTTDSEGRQLRFSL